MPICCSKVAKEDKSCSWLLALQTVAQNIKGCSKVAEHNLFMPTWGGGGGGGFFFGGCSINPKVSMPTSARIFRQFKIILPYHRTFPQIYLAIWWFCRILVMGLDVAMATAFWRACLAEIWISCLFFTLNWIVMLGIKYFGNLEHYCLKKNIISDFFTRSVTSPMNVIQI